LLLGSPNFNSVFYLCKYRCGSGTSWKLGSGTQLGLDLEGTLIGDQIVGTGHFLMRMVGKGKKKGP
jgi:hypothetical protein